MSKETELQRKQDEDLRRADAKLQRNNRDEIILALSEIESDMDIDFTMDNIADAIISGKIPHVKYIG